MPCVLCQVLHHVRCSGLAVAKKKSKEKIGGIEREKERD